MINHTVIEEVQSIYDPERGGEHALDGFEFQVSAAIYLIFSELAKNNDFALIYEKVEDFIIFTDEINLYQAKSINKNLTPNVLYKSKQGSTSIIEKMQRNYMIVKDKVSHVDIKNNLIICENVSFSSKLIKERKNDLVLNFSDLDDEVKREIIKATQLETYNWEAMMAVRLIPKSRHEEVTRIYIGNVVDTLFGDNKINNKALYDALSNEIRRIRKNKIPLTNEFVLEQINKFTTIDKQLQYQDYIHLLNDRDKRNIFIARNFMVYQNLINIKNNSVTVDYENIKNHYNKSKFTEIDEIVKSINENNEFEDMCIRLDNEEIIAIILLVIAKEID